MPKVSVIMGIYNVADTLEEAIDSILAQTFQDFEFIICDDGSTDDSLKIARKYKKKYPDKFVILKNKKNMGLNYTLNHCLKKANGQYIARMDGDDICSADRFEKQVKLLDEHPEYAIVSSLMVLFDEHGEFRITTLVEKPEKNDFVKKTPFHHAPVMIRREAYMSVGGYTVDKRMLRVEDVDLWFKLYGAGYKGYNIQEPLYKMRDDREAVSRRKFRYRINETYAKLKGYHRLGISLRYYPYAFRPIIVGLLPRPVYVYLHRKKNK